MKVLECDMLICHIQGVVPQMEASRSFQGVYWMFS